MKTIYETENYTIREIPLNYRIDIKKNLVLRDTKTRINRDWYTHVEHPLQGAINLAERVSVEYFRPMTKMELKNKKANSERMTKINSATRKMRISKRKSSINHNR